MVVTAVGAVGGGGRTAVGDRTEVALFGASGVRASVLRLSVMQSADGTDWMVVLTDRSGVPISLTVAAAGGFVGGVSDLDFPLAG